MYHSEHKLVKKIISRWFSVTVKETTLLDMVSCMTEKVGLVHQLPHMCDGDLPFSRTVEKVRHLLLTCISVHIYLIRIISLVLFSLVWRDHPYDQATGLDTCFFTSHEHQKLGSVLMLPLIVRTVFVLS